MKKNLPGAVTTALVKPLCSFSTPVLILTILFLSVFSANAQRINRNGNKFTVSLEGVNSRINEIVKPTAFAPGTTAIQHDSTAGVIWLEYGDGGFTTKDSSERDWRNMIYSPFLSVTPLYDTLRGKDLTDLKLGDPVTEPPMSASLKTNDVEMILGDSGIRITPSLFDIVPGDRMTFALTYKSKPQYKFTGADFISGKHYIVLLYNYQDQPVFEKIDGTGSISIDGKNFDIIRKFHGEKVLSEEQVTADPALDSLIRRNGKFGSRIVLSMSASAISPYEQNIFITAMPQADLKLLRKGSATTVKVLLIAENGTNISYKLIDSITLNNMPLRLSHDPNALTAFQQCLVLPKKQQQLSYRVDFQNTGRGAADKVRINVMLPKGILPSTAITDSVFFAGRRSDRCCSILSADDRSGILTLLIDPGQCNATGMRNIVLSGTDGLRNPIADPSTMGSVYFSITATADVEDTIRVIAGIDFHSKARTDPNLWEKTVWTKPALTVYKATCDCINCPGPDPIPCHKFLGLCWWWWVIIVIVLGIIIWIIIKKRNNNG